MANRLGRALGWTAVLGLVACGGKVVLTQEALDGGSAGSTGPAPSAAPTTPAPAAATCADVCGKMVAPCGSGYSTASCTQECESKRPPGTRCAAIYDAFLRCMLAATFECKNGEITITACSEERTAVTNCPTS